MYVQVRGIKGGHHMLYIGVDLGTSAVKLLLMDGAGHIEKIVSKEYPIYFPHPGWSEVSAVRCMVLSFWMRRIR